MTVHSVTQSIMRRPSVRRSLLVLALLAVVAAETADAALTAMRDDPRGRDACIIGEVTADHAGRAS